MHRSMRPGLSFGMILAGMLALVPAARPGGPAVCE